MTTRIRGFAPVAVSLVLGISALIGTAPVPRKSPELMYLDRSGNETLVSSFKDKVVLVEFLLMDCPHCVRVTQMIDKLKNAFVHAGFRRFGMPSVKVVMAPWSPT